MGGPEQWLGIVVWTRNLIESLTVDLRLCMRSLRRNPGFTAAVVSTLSICIAANATTFSVLNAALLSPLAYTEPDRIVRLPPLWTNELAAWRSSTKTLSSMALYQRTELTLAGGDESIRLAGMKVSPELFEVLGSSAMFGRPCSQAILTPSS